MTDDICEHLAWDSAFFGLRIGRVTRERLDAESGRVVAAWAVEQNVDCLYFEADPSDPGTVRAAENLGFRLMDVRLTLSRAVGPVEDLSGRAAIRPSVPSDAGALRSIAGTAFLDTRFAVDPGFAGRAPELYQTWVTRSLDGWADSVWVAEVEGEPAGFLTCHRGEPGGRIGLVGVDPRFRRHGVGTDLVRKALTWFAGIGSPTVRVTTQGLNAEAQRMYQRCGFVTESLRLVYHRWKRR